MSVPVDVLAPVAAGFTVVAVAWAYFAWAAYFVQRRGIRVTLGRRGRGIEIEIAPRGARAEQQRRRDLAAELVRAVSHVDGLLRELEEDSRSRLAAVGQLESRLDELGVREQRLATRVRDLEAVPLPAMEHFVGELQRAERRSSRRDVALFLAGVLTSTVTGVLFQVVFGA